LSRFGEKRKETRVRRLYRSSELLVPSEKVVERSETAFGSRDGSSVDENSEDSESWCENEGEEGGGDHRTWWDECSASEVCGGVVWFGSKGAYEGWDMMDEGWVGKELRLRRRKKK